MLRKLFHHFKSCCHITKRLSLTSSAPTVRRLLIECIYFTLIKMCPTRQKRLQCLELIGKPCFYTVHHTHNVYQSTPCLYDTINNTAIYISQVPSFFQRRSIFHRHIFVHRRTQHAVTIIFVLKPTLPMLVTVMLNMK